MMGRGLAKAGVDKDPVILSFLMDPDFRPYFDISEYCIFIRSYLIYIWGEVCPKQE